MTNRQIVSSLLTALKLPKNADAFMLKRAFKQKIVQNKALLKQQDFMDAYKLSFNILKNNKPNGLLFVWDCLEQKNVEIEQLPVWLQMVQRNSFEDTVFMALLADVSAKRNLQNDAYVIEQGLAFQKYLTNGLYINGRYYISAEYIQSLAPEVVFALCYFCAKSNISLFAVTDKYFTKEFNINLSAIVSEMDLSYNLIKGERHVRSKFLQTYSAISLMK